MSIFLDIDTRSETAPEYDLDGFLLTLEFDESWYHTEIRFDDAGCTYNVVMGEPQVNLAESRVIHLEQVLLNSRHTQIGRYSYADNESCRHWSPDISKSFLIFRP